MVLDVTGAYAWRSTTEGDYLPCPCAVCSLRGGDPFNKVVFVQDWALEETDNG
jgi:hypothetical protein